MGKTAVLPNFSEPREWLLSISIPGGRFIGCELVCEFLIHRGFIGVGYDGGWNVRDEERLVAADTDHPPADDQEDLRKSSVVPRWVIITALAIFASVVIVIIYGYVARPGWIGVSDKTFWDYLELLIVPAALAIGVYLLNRAQESERQAQEAHREQEREAEAEQREREREATEGARRERERLARESEIQYKLTVDNKRAQDAALQAYLDQMSRLLTDAERPLHRAQPGDTLSIVARARTLTVLPRLNYERNARVLQFLYESRMIAKERPVLDLRGADFSAAALRGAYLRGAYLREANLREANLEFANLSNADLSDAEGITNEELEQRVGSLEGALEGATMPNGQKYEDWLRDKEG